MPMRLFVMLVAAVFLLTGCWSRSELTEELFIDGIYLDKGKENGQIQVSISTFITAKLKEGESNGKPFTVISKTGDNIPDTLTLIQKDLTRRLNFSHLQVVLVSEDYGRLGLGELFDWFNREPGLELNTYILSVAGEAKQIAQLIPITEQLPADVFKRFAVQQHIYGSTIKQCLVSAESGMGFPVTALNYGDHKVASENGETERWASIKGLDLFQERAMKGDLDLDQGIALTWGLSHLKDHVYTVTWDGGKSKGSILITRNSSKLTYLGNKEGPLFKIALKGKGSLIYKKDFEGRSDVESNALISDLLEKKVREDMEMAMAKTKQVGADVLNLGMLMEWNNPKDWRPIKEHWIEVYQREAHFQVETNIQINNEGSIR